MEDLKAQLAINTFSNMIDESALEIKETMNENIKEIAQVIESSGGFNLDAWLNEDFSITLDNYSALVGNAWGMERHLLVMNNLFIVCLFVSQQQFG